MRFFRIIKTTLFCCLMSIQTATIAQSREVINIDFDWKFKKEDPAGAEKIDFDDKNWRILNLPHDWSIEGNFSEDAPGGSGAAYLPAGVGWYRKHFRLTQKDLEKIIWVEFGGVYMNSDVWINGHHLGNHPYGYTSFYYDLTRHLKEGENVLAVRVDNSRQPNTRWYTGSGIYRSVRLMKMAPVHFAHWGVYITTKKTEEDHATVSVAYEVENSSNSNKKGTIRAEIVDASGEVVAKKNFPFQVKDDGNVMVKGDIKVTSPKRWSPEQPYLYRLRSTIRRNGKIADDLTTKFGIRYLEFDKDRGFAINGKHTKLNGVCLHHDGGPVGAAVSDELWIRRLQLLKKMGCNAIRTAHNPPSTSFLDLCDELGFLVMDEAFDEWTVGKREFGYHEYFDEWKAKDLASMIRRDRNHPSVIMWSLGNEIPEQVDDKGYEILKELVDIAHKLDPTRPVTAACDKIGAEGFNGPTKEAFLETLDIVGYNYADRWNTRRELLFSLDKMAHPEWKIIGTESRSINGDRGAYFLGNDPTKVSPNYNTEMIEVEKNWKFVATRDYVIGDFFWTGIDHLGEPEWPDKSTSWGAIDYCGFPKDAYYFYKSQWTQEPMVHVFPHWNWKGREGQVIPVLAYTNCDTVELFLNGKSLGEKRISFPKKGMVGGWKKYETPQVEATTNDLHLSWDVPYEPGTLMAVGWKNGEKVVEKIVTTGASEAIRISSDKNTISANSRDIVHFVVEMVDKNGNVVPNDDHLVSFSIEGPGKIIGVGNGNPVDHRSHQSHERSTYHGLALVIVQSTDKPGKITLTAESPALKNFSISVKSEKRK